MSSKGELLSTSCSKTLSAALYLFDFGSNIWVLVEYYKLDYLSTREGDTKFENIYVSNYYSSTSTGAFIAMLTLMLIGHIGIGLAFKLALPPKEHPLRSAYFLPLIQLCRFVSGMWELFRHSRPSPVEWANKPKSRNHHESPKVKATSINHDAYTKVNVRWEDHEKHAKAEALYAIMSASMEGGPLFLLQSIVIYELWIESDGTGFPSPLFLVSLIVSGFSAASNSGRAIMYNLKCDLRWGRLSNGPRLALGFAGGLFGSSALMLHCTTLLGSQVLSVHIVFDENVRHPNWPIILYYSAIILVPFFSFCIVLRHPYNGTALPLKVLVRAIDVMISTYISLSFGPIYPIINDAQQRGELKTHRFYRRLKVLVGLHLLLEIIFVIIFATANFTTIDCNKENLVPYYEIYSIPPIYRFICGPFKTIIIAIIIAGVVMEILSMYAIVLLLIASPVDLEGNIEEEQGTQLQVVDKSTMVKKGGEGSPLQLEGKTKEEQGTQLQIVEESSRVQMKEGNK